MAMGAAETFTMTPVLPTEVTAILADVDWVSAPRAWDHGCRLGDGVRRKLFVS